MCSSEDLARCRETQPSANAKERKHRLPGNLGIPNSREAKDERGLLLVRRNSNDKGQGPFLSSGIHQRDSDSSRAS